MSEFFKNKASSLADCRKEEELNYWDPKIDISGDNFQQEMHKMLELCFNDKEQYLKTHYYWSVDMHIMAVRFIKKEGRVVVTFYDPYFTTVHKRFVFTSADDVKKLTIKNFVDSWLLRKLHNIENSSFLSKNP